MKALTLNQALVALQGGFLFTSEIAGKYNGKDAKGNDFCITAKTFDKLDNSLKMVFERTNMGSHTLTERKYVLA